MNEIPAISAPAAMSPNSSTLLVFELEVAVEAVDSVVVVVVGVVALDAC
jgi:hypothetical protein